MYSSFIFIRVSVPPTPMCVCVPYACSADRGQKRAGDPLALPLQMAVSSYVDAGNRTLVLWKSNECSELLSHLSLSV